MILEAGHPTFMYFGIVPKAEFWFIKLSPQCQPLNSPRNARRIDGDELFSLLSDH